MEPSRGPWYIPFAFQKIFVDIVLHAGLIINSQLGEIHRCFISTKHKEQRNKKQKKGNEMGQRVFNLKVALDNQSYHDSV